MKNARHSDWFALTRADDGTYTDADGFGTGPFTLRVTAIDSQQVTDDFPDFQPGGLAESSGQFR